VDDYLECFQGKLHQTCISHVTKGLGGCMLLQQLLSWLLQANAVPQLMRALAASCQQEQLQQLKPGGQQEEFIVNLLQILANLAEHPQCRTQLQQAGAREMLQGLQEQTSSSLISKAAETAARMASFATWPGVCASS
jgi:hypothetical protein